MIRIIKHRIMDKTNEDIEKLRLPDLTNGFLYQEFYLCWTTRRGAKMLEVSAWYQRTLWYQD